MYFQGLLFYTGSMGIIRDMREPYTALESWFYDRFIAPGVTRFLQEYQHLLPRTLPVGARVLDVGCGGGQNARFVARTYPGVHVTGLDLSAEQIARAGAHPDARGGRLTWLVGDAAAMDGAGLEDNSYDLVYSIASIKHWPDPRRGVAEMVRVARPGGQIVVVEADRACHLRDAARFVKMVGVPRPLAPLALAGFRTWVAGQSLTVDEARALFSGLPVKDARVESVPGAPTFLMSATVA